MVGDGNGGRARTRIQREVKEHILNEFLPQATEEEIGIHTRLISGGILDSIATIMLVTFLEEQYGVRFKSHEVDADHLDTIELIAGTIEAKRR